MEPDDAEDVRRLLTYEERTAGGMMTTEPIVLPPDATVAEALARVRDESPRRWPPRSTCAARRWRPRRAATSASSTSRRLLREPPSTLVGAIVDNDIDWPRPEASLEHVANQMATYNMVALPVVDEDAHLLGAVTVDDVLDHLLPEGWRDQNPDGTRWSPVRG